MSHQQIRHHLSPILLERRRQMLNNAALDEKVLSVDTIRFDRKVILRTFRGLPLNHLLLL
jgi:hypothetical protein